MVLVAWYTFVKNNNKHAPRNGNHCRRRKEQYEKFKIRRINRYYSDEEILMLPKTIQCLDQTEVHYQPSKRKQQRDITFTRKPLLSLSPSICISRPGGQLHFNPHPFLVCFCSIRQAYVHSSYMTCFQNWSMSCEEKDQLFTLTSFGQSSSKT